MKNIKDIVFIIQARTQSTRVPNKMLKPFANSNLFEISINKILQSTIIPKENFYLSVMDQELIDVANKYDVNYFVRSEESTQEPVTLQKALEWYNKLPFKYFVIINACNPLLKVETIDAFIKKFLEVDSNGLFGVFEKKTFLFNNDGVMINRFFGEDKYLATLETKFVETCYEAAHSLYAGSTEDIDKGIYMGSFKKPGDPNFFIMEEIECFDIDWPWQFEVAEKLYNNTTQKNKSLHELGLKYGTDKAIYHNFTPIYDKYLSYLKKKTIRLLEIGISAGPSLKMWEDYFENGEIIGIDILDKTNMNTSRINTMIINQEDANQLLSIPGSFDIILDDGGHTMFQQQLTLKTLFNSKLISGGIYILEDLHTSKETYYSTHGSNKYNNTLNLLYDLQKGELQIDNQYYINDNEFKQLLDEIKSIEIFEINELSITSIIRKK